MDDFREQYKFTVEKMEEAGWTPLGAARRDGPGYGAQWGVLGIVRPYDEDDDYEGPARLALWVDGKFTGTFAPDPDCETTLREWLNANPPREE